ncbi:MAG: sensor histidine kinase [Leptolyngbyaceae cyanobacterium SM1_1_3]|nr:sensor histidine kinase [Leptolyngbyaceae cyanobacterium SM1_1_3]NJN02946.1 sensor histidine kinase [Leptolyngbyaceae cyanobacterium RM1_1_2]NJO08852.1 sensor histidine kinase [Leptolyngbyaceae cyanobacterium SL_1_1]
MQQLVCDRHPFRLLLYLEWILLSIAVLAAFSPLLFSHPPKHFSPPLPQLALAVPLRAAALLSMAGFGLMGLWLPTQSRLSQGLYSAVGLGLSWLAVLLVGHGQSVFPPLLLIVVIRACLLFPWSGRLLVAGLAYASFILMLLLAFLGVRPLGIPLGRSLPALLRRMPSESLQSVLLGLTLNTALLFGLVLGFVLLLVGAVLAESRSRLQLSEANHRLRQYALLIENQATLQERNRIAREIHDSVGHSLVAQSIQLENVDMLLPANSGLLADHLHKARQLGREALQHVRQSVATLRHHPLQGKTLSAAIAALLHEFQQTHAVPIEAEVQLETEPSPEVATAFYRIIQEALTNISKHAQADRVKLSLRDRSGSLTLQIQDNGQGFDPSQNTTGFGLQSMRERTTALGGSFYLQSQPAQGCQIQVVMPRQGAVA